MICGRKNVTNIYNKKIAVENALLTDRTFECVLHDAGAQFGGHFSTEGHGWATVDLKEPWLVVLG